MHTAQQITQPRPSTSSRQPLVARLEEVFADFDRALSEVPIVKLVESGQATAADWRELVRNLRQQVVEGGCWLSRAGSNMSEARFELRSALILHAAREHRDYQMLDRAYELLGGSLDELRATPRNIGSEALSSFIYHRASQPDPVALLGALFVIEGLGARKARGWAAQLLQSRGLGPEHVRFLTYHAEHDEEHTGDLARFLAPPFVDDRLEDEIVRVARVTARLYRLQLEELGTF